MKKLLAIVLTLAMTLAIVPLGASAEEGGIEISFCVGEETLMINGEAITVEKPYVVGKGVTLVPLRVITEAFGAKVEWIEEIRTIKLEYPDVKITLQIDNPIAEVNGKAERLLSAPELKNGFTMVPLRFIAETLGAEVGYDDQTGQITVTKNKAEAGTTVEGGISNAYVGDSYFGWSIENNKKITIEDRSYDGKYTAFVLDYDNYFYVQIQEIPEDYDFEEDFETEKEFVRDRTLVKAEKSEANGIKKIQIQTRNKLWFANNVRIITDKYIYDLYGAFDHTNNSAKNELMRIMSTFKPEYIEGDIFDLSDIKEEWQDFEAESMKLSIELPTSYKLISDENNDTKYIFSSVNPADEDAQIVALLYSKSSVTGAKELAQEEYELEKSAINEDIATFDEVIAQDYNSFSAYEYSCEIAQSHKKTFYKNVFFEKGDYVYNISISVPRDKENKEEFISKVLNSIQVSEPDSMVLGPVLKNKSQPRKGTKEITRGDLVLTIPKTFTGLSDVDEKPYIDFISNAVVEVKIVSANAGTDKQSAAEYVKNSEREIEEEENTSVIKTTSTELMGSNSVTSMKWKKEPKDEGAMYKGIYAISRDSKIYVIKTSCPEISYTKAIRENIKKIVSSAYFK